MYILLNATSHHTLFTRCHNERFTTIPCSFHSYSKIHHRSDICGAGTQVLVLLRGVRWHWHLYTVLGLEESVAKRDFLDVLHVRVLVELRVDVEKYRHVHLRHTGACLSHHTLSLQAVGNEVVRTRHKQTWATTTDHLVSRPIFAAFFCGGSPTCILALTGARLPLPVVPWS